MTTSEKSQYKMTAKSGHYYVFVAESRMSKADMLAKFREAYPRVSTDGISIDVTPL